MFHTQILLAPDKYLNYTPFYGLWAWGSHGVDLFFVISGFIMTYIHLDDVRTSRGRGRYLLSRLTRIYLPYWPVLIALIAVYFLIPGLGVEAGRDPRDPMVILQSLVMWPNTAGVLGVAWTLEHEVVFYLIIFIAILSWQTGLGVFIAWQAASVVHALLATDSEALMRSPFSPYEIEFAMGIVCGLIIRRRSILRHSGKIAAAGAILFLGVGLAQSTGAIALTEVSYPSTITYGLASSLLLIGLVYKEREGWLRVPTFLTFLGGASYAIYLVHSDLITALCKVTKALHLLIPAYGSIVALTIALMVTLAGVGYHSVVESPIIAVSRRWLSSLAPHQLTRQ
jgi:peptidoglycan/LPS O-acetylase OafA/YrhL